MNMFDSLSNWLQLKIVSEARPEDEAAKVSFEHVADILRDVHGVQVVDVKKEGMKYIISYLHEEKQQEHQVFADVAETLLQFINQNPERYEFK